RKADLAQTIHLVRDLTENDTVVALGLHDRDAEARLVEEGETELGTAMELEVLLMGVRRDGKHQMLRVLRGEIRPLDGNHAAADAQRGRLANLTVEVGGVLLDDEVEEVVHLVAHGRWRGGS